MHLLLPMNHAVSSSTVSSALVDLFDFFDVMAPWLDRGQRQTRNAASNPSALKKIIGDFLELREKVDTQIREMLSNLEHDTLLKGISLKPNQMYLQFEEELITDDTSYQMCAFCKHFSTNTVAENEGMTERNERKLRRD